jgi:hypothetical protein
MAFTWVQAKAPPLCAKGMRLTAAVKDPNCDKRLTMIELADTRVSIAIPVALIGALSIAQLALGADPLIVALCGVSIAAPLIPLSLYGRDLYSIIGIVFSLRYAGVALIAKTFYGQPLQQHLFDAYAAFELNALFMVLITAILLIARAMDPGTALFPFPTDLPNLRRLSIFCFCFGFAAEVFVATKPQGGGGSIFVVAATLADFVFLGVIAETIYAIKKSEGRGLITPPLMAMMGLVLLVSLALNMRAFLLTSMIGVVTAAFIYKALRLRHIIIGLAIGVLFVSVLTPITLYLRMQRDGLTRAQFVELAKNTVIKAATDPDFFKSIADRAAYASVENIKGEADFDYYGDRSNVLNRLSYIALLDAVAYNAQTHKSIGMPAVSQALSRNMPGFLGFEKAETAYGMGDWLSWEMDMGTPGASAFLNFGLPMEGLATWGMVGFIAYPLVLCLILLIVYGRLSSLKIPLPTSIFLFTSLQAGMIEDTSDGYLSFLIRGAPMLALGLLMVHKVLFSGREQGAATSNSGSQVPFRNRRLNRRTDQSFAARSVDDAERVDRRRPISSIGERGVLITAELNMLRVRDKSQFAKLNERIAAHHAKSLRQSHEPIFTDLPDDLVNQKKADEEIAKKIAALELALSRLYGDQATADAKECEQTENGPLPERSCPAPQQHEAMPFGAP